MNRKANILNIFFMMIILFAVAIVGLICLVLTTRVNDFYDSSGLLNGTAIGTRAIDQLQDTAPKTTDYAILFLFIGLNAGVLIGAVRTNFSATFLFMFLLLIIVAIIIAAGLVNMYQGLAQQPTIIDVSSSQTFTNFIFSRYFPLIISGLSTLILIIMYSKSGADIQV